MACSVCQSTNQRKFESELIVHFPLPRDAEKHPIVMFPEPWVCMDCGQGEFVVPEPQLARLRKAFD